MMCFDVFVNGRRICRAGVGEAGVLSAIVSWVGGAPKAPSRRARTRAGELDLHVGGLYNPDPETNVHPNWSNQHLHVGDEVVIRIVEADNPDKAPKETISTAEDIERQQREYYEQVKKHLESVEAKPDRSSKKPSVKRSPPRKRRMNKPRA